MAAYCIIIRKSKDTYQQNNIEKYLLTITSRSSRCRCQWVNGLFLCWFKAIIWTNANFIGEHLRNVFKEFFCFKLKYLHLPKSVCIISTIFQRPVSWYYRFDKYFGCEPRKITNGIKGKTLQVKCIDGLVQDCSNSSALEMELLQSYATPSLYT